MMLYLLTAMEFPIGDSGPQLVNFSHFWNPNLHYGVQNVSPVGVIKSHTSLDNTIAFQPFDDVEQNKVGEEGKGI